MEGLPESKEDPRSDRDLKADALSRDHLLTQLPQNVWRKACQRAKMNAKRARHEEVKALSDLFAADHLVSKDDESAGIDKEHFGMVILRLGCLPSGGPM
eukprot:1404419-Heterocapsa_arctica.AAC.1